MFIAIYFQPFQFLRETDRYVTFYENKHKLFD